MELENSQNQKRGNSSSVPLTPSEFDSLNKAAEDATNWLIENAGMDPNILCHD